MNVQPNAEAIEAGAQALQDAPSDRTMIHTFSLADDGVSAVDTKRVEVHVEPGEAARAVLAAAMPHLRAQWLAEVDALLLTEAATWEASDHPDANEIWHHYMAAVAFLSNHYSQPSAAMSRPTTPEEV